LVLGDYEQAIRDASLAVSLDRENEDSRFLRGLIAMLIREFDVAEADFRLLRPEYQRFVGDSMAAFEGLSDPPFNWELNLPTKFGKVSLCVQLGPVDMEAAGTQVQ